jgi:hypothetical protein
MNTKLLTLRKEVVNIPTSVSGAVEQGKNLG